MRNLLFPLVLLIVPIQGVTDLNARGLQESETPGPSEADAHLAELARGVEKQVAEIRGLEFKRPVEVHFADKERFVEYYHSMEDRMGGAELTKKEELMAVLLQLIPSDVDLGALQEELLATQVGGFYDPATDAFYVMEGLEDDLIRIIMSHELTHALDDQHYDLAAKDKELMDNNDSLLAHHAVIEGSAQVVMNRWLVQNLASLDRAALLQFQAKMDAQELLSAPRLLWKPFFALYMQGQAFLCRKDRFSMFATADIADLDRAFQNLPVSTEQILHPGKYWTKEDVDLPHRVKQGLARLPEGWSAFHSSILGELYLGLLCGPADGEVTAASITKLNYTDASTSGWGGDRVQILAKGDSRVLILDTFWDTAGDAREFQEALDGRETPEGSDVQSVVVRQTDSQWVRLVAWTSASKDDALNVASTVPASASRSGTISGLMTPEPQTK
ncbi:MAG: hypothetical protein KDB61_03380 [Planctomycetes bacterium]|nr:hypothetical protein [Planctomycetota bacterium]